MTEPAAGLSSNPLELINFLEYPLGSTLVDGYTLFRFFSPRAHLVELELFENYDQKFGDRFDMKRDSEGIWNLLVEENLEGRFYGYHISAPVTEKNFFHTDALVADPWCRMAATANNYRQYPKSLVVGEQEFDWEDDQPIRFDDPRDMIIYEAHLKDLTFHKSAGCSSPGTYLGLVEKGQRGGIEHLKKLGVNAVELLPLQKFAYYEPPYNKLTEESYKNTWNYYSKNYWGYMTSFFFVPETMYASTGTHKAEQVIGRGTEAIREFKQMVKAFHNEGIAVIMDVVYNHVSQYDMNPFKFADLEYYFYLDDHGYLRSNSGTGNDFKSYSPLARKAIIDSVLYWMEEFHVDGFRFDLAHILDWETIDAIQEATRAKNPDVILIAEPWGGGYDPKGFSHHGWPAWNDQIRNGAKGSHPTKDKGYIFGKWQHSSSRMALENTLRGTLEHAENGRFVTSAHSLNYLEAHDGYTLGDFIRIGLNEALIHTNITDREAISRLNDDEMALAKLGALYLFSAQGITMIHEGQEWARSKVIEPVNPNDPHTGQLDHNSYEKDNRTNYLDFDEIALNQSLFEYYRGLIELRKSAPALRKSEPADIVFHTYKDPLHITFTIYGKSSGDQFDYFLSMNANRTDPHFIVLPEGTWDLIADDESVGTEPKYRAKGTILVPPSSGMILRRLRQ